MFIVFGVLRDFRDARQAVGWRKMKICTDCNIAAYKSFKAWALTQQHCKAIKVLCSNRRGKYLSGAFDKHLVVVGMTCRLTPHNTPQLDSMVEWLNCMLLEQVHALRYTSSLPKSLWGEVLRHTTWLKNWTAMCVLDGKTPFEALYS